MEVPINTKEKTVSIDKSAAHFGPVWLAPGISKLNAFTLLYVSYATIGLLVLITIRHARSVERTIANTHFSGCRYRGRPNWTASCLVCTRNSILTNNRENRAIILLDDWDPDTYLCHLG